MTDTPRAYCPGCLPDADEFAELLVLEFCGDHRPDVKGADDARVGPSWWASGNAEVGGPENRAACDFIHRGRAEEVPMDEAPLIAEGTFVAVARPGTLPPPGWDWE